MDRATLSALNAARRARMAAVLVSDLDSGAARVVTEDAVADDPLAEALRAAFASGKAGVVATAGQRVFLNPHLPPARLVIIGAVHISQALAPMARQAGLDVTIIDPRTAFATPARFGAERLIADWPEDALQDAPLDRWTALAALTHDPKIDDAPLVAALRAGCFYVGALGSRKTHAARLDRLHAAGLTGAETGRICAPIGLDIGAASPAEIAVATLAQLIAHLRRRAP